MQQQSYSICVSYIDAETILKILRKHKLVNSSLEFIREEDCLIIPVTLNKEELHSFLLTNNLDKEVKTNIHTFQLKEYRPKSLFEAVKKDIPKELHELIPKAYDVIGDIVVVDIHKDILDFKKEIGDSLFSLFPSIQTVYRKASSVAGELRIRDLELLAGEEKCTTIHNEHKIRIVVDVCQTYFSPRLASEHKRVANQVKDHEIIADLFTGVGPFPLHITTNKKARVYAIDINSEALDCLKQSIEKNKIIGEIFAINEDCRLAVSSLPKVDRVIMNLPGKSIEFIDVACQIIKPQGILYFYKFVQNEKAEEIMLEILQKELKKNNWEISEKISFQRVRESAPREIHGCLEVSIQPT